MNYSGLYVHIPFCKSKCGYCDFNSYANREECMAPYFSALMKEIEMRAREYPLTVDTVYFGGGTPSFVEPSFILATLKKLRASFHILPNAEITMECNPGTIGFEGLKKLREGGINRLSIGLQSVCDGMLKTLGRIHTFEDFSSCFKNAREAGFQNISLDLMYGLPGQSLEDWKNTLAVVAEFGCEHISAYSLKIEEGTPFSKMELDLPDEDTVADMYEYAVRFLEGRGYGRYEISNFSKAGFESRHNLKYWEYNDFLGLGAGAYSCIMGKRFSNVLDIEEYICTVKSGKVPCDICESLSEFDQMSEFVFLGLRLERGISERDFEDRFGRKVEEIFGEAIEKYVNLGFLLRESGRIKFSPKGFFVSNTILSDFV